MSMSKQEILEHAIHLGAECQISVWMDLKKMLLVSLPSSSRALFSVRDPKTKKQKFNEFESWLYDNYESKTGVKLKRDF